MGRGISCPGYAGETPALPATLPTVQADLHDLDLTPPSTCSPEEVRQIQYLNRDFVPAG